MIFLKNEIEGFREKFMISNNIRKLTHSVRNEIIIVIKN